MFTVTKRNGLIAGLLFLSTLLSNASTTTIRPHIDPTKGSIRAQISEDASSIFESLEKDVSRHPDDFIVFETRMSADEFIMAHKDEAYYETEQRAVMRGILGYWRGKTIVILPRISAGITW